MYDMYNVYERVECAVASMFFGNATWAMVLASCINYLAIHGCGQYKVHEHAVSAVFSMMFAILGSGLYNVNEHDECAETPIEFAVASIMFGNFKLPTVL